LKRQTQKPNLKRQTPEAQDWLSLKKRRFAQSSTGHDLSNEQLKIHQTGFNDHNQEKKAKSQVHHSVITWLRIQRAHQQLLNK
jgi:hypothetical protein